MKERWAKIGLDHLYKKTTCKRFSIKGYSKSIDMHMKKGFKDEMGFLLFRSRASVRVLDNKIFLIKNWLYFCIQYCSWYFWMVMFWHSHQQRSIQSYKQHLACNTSNAHIELNIIYLTRPRISVSYLTYCISISASLYYIIVWR